MDRRNFLRALLGGGVAVVTLDPEKLLWVPGEKLISIPSPPTIEVCSTLMCSTLDTIMAQIEAVRPALEDLFNQNDVWLRQLEIERGWPREKNKRRIASGRSVGGV